jgi:uncharacterized OB-fold protein
MHAPSPLHFQRCAACDVVLGYPRVLCPGCGGRDLSWIESAGAGTVYSATTVHTREEAYAVLLVDLDEGVRVMGAGDGLGIGARAQASIDRDGRLVFG